jgi:Beta protein
MFDETHYVPVLRWKGAERGALRDVSASDRTSVTPLIELLPGHMRPRRKKHGPVTSDDFWVVVEQLVDAWGPLPLFLDVSRAQNTPYRGSRDCAAIKLFSALGAAGLHIIPTASLNQPTSFQETVAAVAKIDNRGAAMRIPITQLGDAQLGETLRQLVERLETSPEAIDLIVEYGLINSSAPTLSYVCHRVPMLKRWRTFTVLAGSFPHDLIEFRKPGQYEIPREEWTQWVRGIQQIPALLRRPAFGDYTNQHPIYEEPIEGANPSVSIRYASDTYHARAGVAQEGRWNQTRAIPGEC